jgi:hypothetical protein
MADRVGARELRQNLSRYLERVKVGETRVSSRLLATELHRLALHHVRDASVLLGGSR